MTTSNIHAENSRHIATGEMSDENLTIGLKIGYQSISEAKLKLVVGHVPDKGLWTTNGPKLEFGSNTTPDNNGVRD